MTRTRNCDISMIITSTTAFHVFVVTRYKCTKHQFTHLLTATFKDLHIENSKNYKRWYCPHHNDCVWMCCWIISPFVIFAVFRCASPWMLPLASVWTDVFYIYICCFITKILFSYWWSVTKILRFRYFLQ